MFVRTWHTVSLAFALALILPTILPGSGHDKALALDNGLALTPPMGWNSWNHFGKGGFTEQTIFDTIDAMVSSGMKDAGYEYIVIDGGWRDNHLAPDGSLLPHPKRFPNGMKPVADYAHANGLKFGLHTCPGETDCGRDPVGGLDREALHVSQFVEWEVDFIKLDSCYIDRAIMEEKYKLWRDLFAASGRDILFSMNAGRGQDWQVETGNMNRTTGDIRDSWEFLSKYIDLNNKYASAAGPGFWNDPDMMQVGNFGEGFHSKDTGMNEIENRTHFSMWCIMASPLMAGNDLRDMPQVTKDILTNKEVIAVNQDPLGIQGTPVWDDGEQHQVWAKRMADGSVAVALLNRGESATDITANWSDIGVPSGSATVRDLWEHADKGSHSGSYTASVPSHGVVMLRIAGK